LTNERFCDIINIVEEASRFSLSTYISPSKRLASSTNAQTNWWADVFTGWQVGKQRISAVYEIVNVINGHRYVGSATYLPSRWEEHRRTLRLGTHHSKYLQRAWNLYGEEAFEFNIIVYVPPMSVARIEDIIIYEEHPEYNMKVRAGSTYGKIFTDEHILNLSLSHMGHTISEEHRLKLIEVNTGNTYTKGKKQNLSDKIRQEKRDRMVGNTFALGRKVPPDELERRTKSILAHPPNLKIFYGTLVSPDGVEYKDVINLSAFGRDHDIDSRLLHRIIKGKQRTTKGWIFYR
jgi:group I intron endonuclease